MRVPCWSRPLGALVAGALLSTACGSRVEQRVLEATNGSLAVAARGPAEPGTATGPAAAPLSTAVDPNATAVAANAGGPSAGRFPGADAGGPSAERTSGADAGKGNSRPSATGVSGAAEWTPAARQQGRTPADAVPRAGQGPAASGAGSKGPIILGAFGVQSGILGAFVTGMLVERIAPLLGDVPSAQGLIAALLSLQGETLGGLIPPITFPDSADRTKVNHCVVPQTVRNGTFVAHDAAESFVCAPDWAPGK